MAMAPDDSRMNNLLVTITIGADGRVYFHEMTPALVPVAEALRPSSKAVACGPVDRYELRTETSHEQSTQAENQRAAQRAG
jgi:hypothetical protein